MGTKTKGRPAAPNSPESREGASGDVGRLEAEDELGRGGAETEAKPRLREAGALAEGAPQVGAPVRQERGGRVERAVALLVDGVVGGIEATRGWLPVAVLISAAPGLFLWPLLRPELREHLLDNQLDRAARGQAFAAVLTSMAVILALYAAVAVRRWRRDGRAAALEGLRRMNDQLLWVLALPLIPALMVDRIETRSPFLTLAMTAAIGAVICVATYRLQRPRSPLQETPRSRWVPLVVVLVLAAAYGAMATIFSVNNHHNLMTAAFDLGIYDNMFWQTLHGRPLGSVYHQGGTHLSAHAEPIIILLSPLYLIYPRAELLLVLQAFWIGSTAIPVYLLARDRLGRPWHAVGLALAVLLCPALHGTNFYDFHTLSLISPVVIWTIWCLETGRLKLYWAFAVVLLLIREDMPLLLCFIAAYAVLSRRAVRTGLATVPVALIYLFIIKHFVMVDSSLIMSSSSGARSYAYYYQDLIPHSNEGALGLLISAVTNPFFTLRHAFSLVKLEFLAKLFLPVLLLPLIARRGKVMMVYGLAFILLASKGPVFTVHFQYTAILFPVLFALAVIALSELEAWAPVQWFKLDARRLVTALVVAMVATTAAVSAKYGAIVPNDAFRAGFNRPQFRMTEEARALKEWLDETVATIPRDLAVTTTWNLAAHVSNRRRTAVFPRRWGAEYLLLDSTKLDRWGEVNLDLLEREGVYELIRENDRLKLYRRRPGVDLPERLPDPAPRRRRPSARRSRVSADGDGGSRASLEHQRP